MYTNSNNNVSTTYKKLNHNLNSDIDKCLKRILKTKINFDFWQIYSPITP